MSNPFTDALDDNLRGREARVVGCDGAQYRGIIDRIHHHDRHVLLRGATNLDTGTQVGSVLVSHANVIEEVNPTERVERIRLDAIEPAPYHEREFDATENRGYIEQVRQREFVGSFPVVRPLGDGDLDQPSQAGFETVEGHKRLWVAREAGLDFHPVRVLDLSDEEAAERFVLDHLPAPEHVGADGDVSSGYYDNEETAAVLEALGERFGADARSLPRVRYNADRLDVTLDESEDTGSKSDAEAGDGSDGERALAVGGPDDLSEETTDTIRDAIREKGSLQTPPGEEGFNSSEINELLDLLGVPQSEVAGKNARDRRERLLEAVDGADSREFNIGQRFRHEELVEIYADVPDRDEEAAEEADIDVSELDGSDEGSEGLPPDASIEELHEPGELVSERVAEAGYQTIGDVVDAGADGLEAIDYIGKTRAAAIHSEAEERLIEDDDESDDASEEAFPRTCHCGATLEDSLELAIHRTEAHGVPQATIDHLEAGEFEEIVEDADNIQDVADELGRSTTRVMRMLGIYGLEDVVGTDGREISDVTDVDFQGVDAGGDAEAAADGGSAATTPSNTKSTWSPADISQAAREHDTVSDVADAVDTDLETVRKELYRLDLDDEVEDLTGAYRGGSRGRSA